MSGQQAGGRFRPAAIVAIGWVKLTSSRIGGRVRPPRRLIAIAVFALALAGAAGLCLAAGGCGFEHESASDEPEAAQARTLELARDACASAAAALLAGDREGFEGALRVEDADGGADAGAAARASLAETYEALSALPWRAFSFEVTPVDPAAGLYRIRGYGQLGAAGPPDRIGVVRYLVLRASGERVTVLADETPAGLRRRYLMALHDPVVVQRPGLVVLGDRRARDRVESVAAAAARARRRLSALGVSTRPAVVITVFASAEDVRDSLGIEEPAVRLVFFAYPALRVAGDPWSIQDVGVMGPWLRDAGDSLESAMTHELAHAFTVRWFAGSDHAPALLVEGIAQAAEGGSTTYLRREVASGNQLWPLPESFASEDLWAGNDAEAVGLGYEIGGSLVGYVLDRWGARKVRSFVQAVADAEPTEAGMDLALGEALGVAWREFYDDWRVWVLREP